MQPIPDGGRTRPGDPTIRVGADISAVAEIARSIEMFGDRYLDRIYTPLEILQSGGRSDRIAARFAGKEAVVKILRPSPSASTPLRDIEIATLPSGAPHVRLRGGFQRLAETARLERVTVSLSHEGDFAAAVAVGQFAPEAPSDNGVADLVRRAVERHGGLARGQAPITTDRDLREVGLTERALTGILLTLEDELGLWIHDEAVPSVPTLLSITRIVESRIDSTLRKAPKP